MGHAELLVVMRSQTAYCVYAAARRINAESNEGESLQVSELP